MNQSDWLYIATFLLAVSTALGIFSSFLHESRTPVKALPSKTLKISNFLQTQAVEAARLERVALKRRSEGLKIQASGGKTVRPL